MKNNVINFPTAEVRRDVHIDRSIDSNVDVACIVSMPLSSLFRMPYCSSLVYDVNQTYYGYTDLWTDDCSIEELDFIYEQGISDFCDYFDGVGDYYGDGEGPDAA